MSRYIRKTPEPDVKELLKKNGMVSSDFPHPGSAVDDVPFERPYENGALPSLHFDRETPIYTGPQEKADRYLDYDTIDANYGSENSSDANGSFASTFGGESLNFAEVFGQVYPDEWDSIASTERSSLYSWGDEEFESKTSVVVRQLFDDIDAMLYEGCISNKEVSQQAEEWCVKYPHLRVLGKQISACMDFGYSFYSTSGGEDLESVLLVASSLPNSLSSHISADAVDHSSLVISGSQLLAQSLTASSELNSRHSEEVSFEEEIIESHGTYEEVLAIDSREFSSHSLASSSTFSGTLTLQRKGLPPVSPSAVMMDSILANLFQHTWVDIVSWLKPLFLAYLRALDSKGKNRVLTTAGNLPVLQSSSRKTSLPTPRTAQAGFERPNALHGLLTVSSKALQMRPERISLSENLDHQFSFESQQRQDSTQLKQDSVPRRQENIQYKLDSNGTQTQLSQGVSSMEPTSSSSFPMKHFRPVSHQSRIPGRRRGLLAELKLEDNTKENMQSKAVPGGLSSISLSPRDFTLPPIEFFSEKQEKQKPGVSSVSKNYFRATTALGSKVSSNQDNRPSTTLHRINSYGESHPNTPATNSRSYLLNDKLIASVHGRSLQPSAAAAAQASGSLSTLSHSFLNKHLSGPANRYPFGRPSRMPIRSSSIRNSTTGISLTSAGYLHTSSQQSNSRQLHPRLPAMSSKQPVRGQELEPLKVYEKKSKPSW